MFSAKLLIGVSWCPEQWKVMLVPLTPTLSRKGRGG